MSDEFTETTSKSWFGRIAESLKAILVGIVLVVLSAVLMFWNEGRSAKTAAALTEGAGTVVAVTADRVDPTQEGKLVHIAGNTTVGKAARDADFGFDANGLRLVRKVEMYQWKEESHSETQKKVGGGEETVTHYTYTKEWSDHAVDSSRFRNVNDHRNPPMPSIASRTFFPGDAKLGAFGLTDQIIQKVSGGEKFMAPDAVQPQAISRLGQRARVLQGDVYVGANPDQPVVGDVRMSWQVLPIMPVSVVGRQTHDTITPWIANNGREVMLVEAGIADPALMFKHGQESNAVLTWVLRLVGVLLMFIGFRLALSLLQVLADVVPFIGSIVGAGASLVALLCTVTIASIVIAVAWLFYRPLIAAGIFVVGGIVAYGIRQLMKKRAGGLPSGDVAGTLSRR